MKPSNQKITGIPQDNDDRFPFDDLNDDMVQSGIERFLSRAKAGRNNEISILFANHKSWKMVGNSMDDGMKGSIPDGSFLNVQPSNTNEVFIHPGHYLGKPVIIVYKDGIHVGIFKSCDTARRNFKFCSLNPNKTSYPDVSIHLDNISEFLIVTGSQTAIGNTEESSKLSAPNLMAQI